MPIVGSIDAVTATIRDEANEELDRIRGVRDEEIARLRELPAAASPGNRERLISEAHRRNNELLAQMEWEEKRRVIEQREAWIARVIRRGSEILATADAQARKATLAACVREAMQSVRGDAIEIRVADVDRSLLEDIAPEAKAGQPAAISGGCVVRSGALGFDNSFEARAKRLEPAWRKALAAMYRV